jgi:histidine triad (HIT) family protein
MKAEKSCIFCKVVKKELPSSIVYETEEVLGFLDIRPINFGHTLIIPKAHYSLLDELPPPYFSVLLEAIQKVGSAIKKALDVPAYNIVLNNGPAAGQVIPHLHFHLIPRIKGDGLSFHPPGKSISDQQLKEIQEKITSCLKET